MKVMLGRGWYQEVTLNEKSEQVIRYMKDGKEYSREEWIKSKEETVPTVKESFIQKVRRKIANIIYPVNDQTKISNYPFVEMKQTSLQSEDTKKENTPEQSQG